MSRRLAGKHVPVRAQDASLYLARRVLLVVSGQLALTRCEAGLGRPVVKLTVRRTHLFEDGLTSLMLKAWEAS